MATNTYHTTIYRTIQGDAWDSIAFKLWPKAQRSELLMHHLITANPEHMDTLVFSAGIELIIPEIEMPQIELDVPAWRQSI